MRLSLDEMQTDIRDAAREVARGRIAPQAARWDEEGALAAGLLKELAELGFLGLLVEEGLGGSALDRTAFALVILETAKASGAAAVALAAHNSVALASSKHAKASGITQELCGGERVGVLTEFREGSLTGFCGFAAPWAAVASPGVGSDAVCLVSGQATDASETQTPGLGLRALRPHTLVAVPGEDDAVVSGVAAEAELTLRLGLAAAMVGRGEAALAASLAYAKEREQFGKPIASFQAIQWMIADARCRLDGAWLLTLRAAFTGRQAAMACVHAAQAARETCDAALQIHGGYGYTTEYPVERCLRDSLAISTLAGGLAGQRSAVAGSALD